MANGCVPAEPIVSPRLAALSRTWRRNERSCSPASTVFRHGLVAISSTDSMSSGLISPCVASSSRDSIALTSSRESRSTIMSSSSMPIVKAGPVKWCSMGRGAYPGREGTILAMALGYDGKLYILAFDHRGSFQKKMFGIEGNPDDEQTRTISDAKHLIFEGMAKANERGAVAADQVGVLVDEQFGGSIPADARSLGLKLAMPVEKSGQDMFDFEYGEDFAAHIEQFDPDFSKVLVRYNPDADAEANREQLGKLKRLADWLHDNGRKFLFELLVPATDEQLASVDGDTDRYDAELRPDLMRRAIEETQDFGVEVDIWKIEGVDERSDAQTLARTTRRDGRDGVVCVLLGRGASNEKVNHWLRQAARVDGFIGFAIGRSIWGDALTGYINGSLEREAATKQVAENYLRFVKVYEDAEAAQPAGA